MSEINEHCQCDNCSGRDCGQDDPDRYLEQKIQDEEKHDEEVRKEERERVLNLYKDFVKVRIAQGISGVSFCSMLTYLSHPSDVENEISALCAVSGKSIEQLREIAETRIKLESLRSSS